MTKRMSLRETRQNLSDVLGMVYYGKESVIAEKKGNPMAVLIGPEQFERFEQQANERLGAVTEQIWKENADEDSDEVYRDVTAAAEEVRQRRYDEQRSEDAAGREPGGQRRDEPAWQPGCGDSRLVCRALSRRDV